MHLSKRNKRFVELAKRMASKSLYERFRHGAVLVKGGSVINVASNSKNFSSFGNRFREECGHATHHAELGAILGVDSSTTNGSVIYVVRINKKGELRMSKPCKMCHQVLKFVGVKKVIYSLDNKCFESYRL